MKVLQINSVCGIRSTGRICTDIADTLKSRGDDCKVAYGREIVPEKHQQYTVRIGTETDVRAHVLQSRIFDNMGKGSKKATKEFLKWVDEYNPDAIHLHNIHGYYINTELLFDYLKKAKKPVIWTFHDCWPFTGHCACFEMPRCEKWKEDGCNGCSHKNHYPASILFNRARKNFIEKKQYFTGIENMTIVTPSQWLADLVKASFLKDYDVKVIHNGIDLSVFKPVKTEVFCEKYNLQDKKILLGVASMWGKGKGLFDFYKINEIKAQDEVVVLVGLSEKQLSALPEGIIGISRTNSTAELAEVYSSADVFINPTYSDNYPTVNLEAQACGTPAVTYRTGGSVESVPSANVVPQGDVQALLNRARELVNAPEIMDAKNFARDDRYLEYIELYSRLAD